MKKIVFKVSHYPVVSQTFVTNQIISALDLGYNVSILVNKKKSIEFSSHSELIKKYKILDKVVQYNNQRPNSRFKIVSKAIYLCLTKHPLNYLKFLSSAYRVRGVPGLIFYDFLAIHSVADADIFHIQFGNASEPLARLKNFKMINGKLLVTFHGYDVHFSKENFETMKQYYKELFNIVSFFTANTQYLANQLLQLGCPKNKLAIVPMGVDVNFFKPLVKKKSLIKISLISVGRLTEWKGHLYGILAINELIKKGYDICYTIIGEGVERNNLKKMIEKLDLDGRVILKGSKSQKYIKRALQNSDIYLMTSTYDKTGRRETQGVVSAEAQACGLPVCAFNSGGVPYTLIEGKTGFLSDENDYLDMALKIECLITDPDLRKTMSLKARKFIINNYSLENSTKKMNNIYRKLLNTRV